LRLLLNVSRREQCGRQQLGLRGQSRLGATLISQPTRSAGARHDRGVCGMRIGSKSQTFLLWPDRRRDKTDMKKPTLRIEQQQPRKIQRADIAPDSGYALVVDGHFKTQFSEQSVATKAATELLSRYPMLQVEIYDAKAKGRIRVEQVKAATH
jgi:hypothetical protein